MIFTFSRDDGIKIFNYFEREQQLCIVSHSLFKEKLYFLDDVFYVPQDKIEDQNEKQD